MGAFIDTPGTQILKAHFDPELWVNIAHYRSIRDQFCRQNGQDISLLDITNNNRSLLPAPVAHRPNVNPRWRWYLDVANATTPMRALSQAMHNQIADYICEALGRLAPYFIQFNVVEHPAEPQHVVCSEETTGGHHMLITLFVPGPMPEYSADHTILHHRSPLKVRSLRAITASRIS